MTTTERSAMEIHEKARTLAAEAIDAALAPEDAAWLAAHLKHCAACKSVAAEYRSIRNELRGLAAPEPPRDLWARTAAGLDAVDASRSRSGRVWNSTRWGFFARNRLALARAGAVGLTATVASLALLSGGLPGGPPAGGASASAVASGVPAGNRAPVAVVAGNGYWVAPSGGVYQITSGSAECADAAGPCAVGNDGGIVMASVASTSAVSVSVAPDASQAAVWTSDKIVILPLGDTTKTVSIDLLTPRPTATASPAATATAESSASAGSSDEPSASPDATSSPTPAPTRGPEVAPQPVAILDGYRIVGRAPEFSAGGEWVAFSARPVDQNAGADVYVWRAGWERAERVTDSRTALFAGWFGSRILISDFVSAAVAAPTPGPDLEAGPSAEASPTPEATPSPPIAVSVVYDPVSGLQSLIRRPMLLPSVDPTGTYLVYWTGTVSFNATTGLWEAGQGDLYFDAWSNLALLPIEPGQLSGAVTFEPRAEDGQLLPVGSGPGAVQRWVVRWDAPGRNVAVWVGDPGSADLGRVTLFRVDPGAGRLEVGTAVLSAVARSNVAFDEMNLVYTAPGDDGKGQTYIVPVPEPSPTRAPTATPEASAATAATASPQEAGGLRSPHAGA